MNVELFVDYIEGLGIKTIAGVPDSTLKQFCEYINTDGEVRFKHYVPENEGGALGIATGVYLSTNKPACVYMQNSGLGNIVNPVTSINNYEVYDIPVMLIVGWRGEPGERDEPQHKFMGKITEEILSVLEIPYAIIGSDTSEDELAGIFSDARKVLEMKRQFAVLVKKDTFDIYQGKIKNNNNIIKREEAITEILKIISNDDVVISTTGKISREVYEQSEILFGQHAQDFLTVGGMGHASMIALGLANNITNREKKVFCLDGDGAVLMHMGSLAVIGRRQPENLIHVCLNNDAHESVGGMPTGAAGQSYSQIAKSCGYNNVFSVYSKEELSEVLVNLRNEKGPVFLEIKVSLDARMDLGRPKESAIENKNAFMKYHEVI